MKKKTPYVIAWAMLLTAIGTLAFRTETTPTSPEVILYVDPPTTAVHVNKDFTVNVTVEDVVDLFAFDLHLGYNTTILDALTVVVLPPFDKGVIFPPIVNDSEGYVRVSGSLLPGEPSLFGSFPLATITFNTTSLGNSTLHLYNTNLTDSASNSIAHDSVDGSVIVYPRTITVPDDYPTIQEAINAANQGDTVYVKAGTYYESIVLDKTLSLMGENRSTTVIDGNMSDYVVKIRAENIRISGFTIKNAHFVHVRIYSDNNVLRNNRIIGAGAEISYWGVYLGLCDNNTVEGNIIKGCGEGIMVESSSYNKIMENTIVSNHRGIRLTTAAHIPEEPPPPPSCYNTVYHNNLVNNSFPAFDGGLATIWDDDSEGNYWSSYNGTDSDGNGIGDTPHIINPNGQDNYPLMYPYPSHEIAIINMVISDIHPKINETIGINVTVSNMGHFTEIFGVNLNYTWLQDPSIGTQTITLTPHEIITISFTWIFTASGRYEIKAYTSKIPDETDLTNNIRIKHVFVGTSSGSGGSNYMVGRALLR